MRRSWASVLSNETVLFWSITLVICAIVCAAGYGFGRAFVDKYMAGNPSRLEARAVSTPEPGTTQVRPRPITPEVVVLDREPTEAERIELQLPPPEEPVPQEPEAERSTEPQAEQGAEPAPAPAVSPGVQRGPETQAQPSRPAPTASPAPGPASQTPAPQPQQPQPPASSWVATAGSYRDRANADQVAAALSAKGLDATVQSVTLRGETFHRVVVGPFASREDAEKASAQVKYSGYESQVLRQR
ncbi:MAG: SPOR domain-containing protein [Armatimonadetes bacterium]|nr:SPOR domain-containing protein [Armatimonadota bacterium]